MRDMGIGIYATGGETADVGDLVRTIIVDSTVTCRMKRKDVIDNANICPGDVIVGLASFGQATYEDHYNGGMGSNGLTSARHDVFSKYLAEKYPESYDHAVPAELCLQRKLQIDRHRSGRTCKCRTTCAITNPHICTGHQENARRITSRDTRNGALHRRRTDQGASLRRRQLQGCKATTCSPCHRCSR